MTEIFLILCLAHLAADFPLQSGALVKRKARGAAAPYLHHGALRAHEWVAVKSGRGIVENRICREIPLAQAPRFPALHGLSSRQARLPARPFHRAHDPFARGGGKR